VFVSLVCLCLLINAGGAVYLLARSNLERGKKALFAVAALASLALKLALATRGHNYDLDSYRIVASLVLQGKSVYAHTSRFNYGPLWAYILAGLEQLSTFMPAMGAEALHVAVAAFLGVTDVALAAILAAKYRYGAGIFFLCCPATILLTGYHSQFENFALLAGLASWLLIRDGSTTTPRLVFAAGLQGVSLVIKHVLFLFPLWVFFWPKLGSLGKRIAYVAIAYGIFGSAFLPWMFDPASRAGIVQNVFQYRSVFNLSFSRLIISFYPFAMVSPATSSVLTVGWLAVLILAGIVATRKDDEFFPLYLLAMFAFSPALMHQYLAIPLLACAILYTSWPSWALVGTAIVALFSSPAEIFRFPFTIADYTATVSTQICAAALLLVQLQRTSPLRAAPLPLAKGAQKAVTLAFGSLALVFLIFVVKLLALPGAGPVHPLINK
jgi:hypothetical protein